MEFNTVLKFITLLLGLYMAWNIGANDVANAMGTSVGSKALTLKRAVFLAAILEFCGAFFVGSSVSQTIQGGIVNLSVFQTDPMLFVIGMMSSLLATGILLQIASYFGLPISTTHAIVGAVVGFGLITGGMEAIHWKKMGLISSSWILSPVLSGAVAYFLFAFIQRKILFTSNPLKAAKKIVPYFIFLCSNLIMLSLSYQGLNELKLNLSFIQSFAISCPISLGFSLLGYTLLQLQTLIPKEKKIDLERIRSPQNAKANPFPFFTQNFLNLTKKARALTCTQSNFKEHLLQKKEILHSNMDISLDSALKSRNCTELPTPLDNASYGAEKIFSYLQIISACLVAFAHGANDISNAIGPVAAILNTLQTNTLDTESVIPSWLLLFGGLGIVLGLATWGWRVIETIGKKITELTPSRGFSAEFGAAITILFASKLGLPISTTHALVGAICGVGMAQGTRALNYKTLKEIIVSWLITIPLCATLSIILFYLLDLFRN